MKICSVGDVHGDIGWLLQRVFRYAQLKNCEVVVQNGDFGYFGARDERDGSRYLDKISKYAVKMGLKFFWLDGNHDNHIYLWEHYAPDETGMIPMRENVTHLPRGCVWEWDDVRFMSVGGAYSIDKAQRLKEEAKTKKPLSRWWPTEILTEEQAQFAAARGPVDVMFTHDAPIKVDVPGIHAEEHMEFPLSWDTRRRLQMIVEKVKPKLLVHGHHHVRYTNFCDWRERDGWHRTRVEGLACNGMAGSVIYFDTDKLRRYDDDSHAPLAQW